MNTNKMHEDARTLTCPEFPTKWVWQSKEKIRTRRKQGRCIGRIAYIYPTSGELYYLRILLNIIKGPKSYEDIRTFAGIFASNISICM